MLRRRAMMRRPIARVGAAAVGTAVVVGTAGAVHHRQQKKYAQQDAAAQAPVSYTHLTLPTTPYV